MQSHHLTDTDATASHATTWCSPVPMVRALRDPVNDAAHIPVPMPEVHPPGKQTFHLQYTTTCVIMSHPPQTSSLPKHRMMLAPHSMSISQQCH